MAWLVTVPSTRPCGFTYYFGTDGTCEDPATTRAIDDNGVEQGLWCRWHAQAFLDQLRAVS